MKGKKLLIALICAAAVFIGSMIFYSKVSTPYSVMQYWMRLSPLEPENLEYIEYALDNIDRHEILYYISKALVWVSAIGTGAFLVSFIAVRATANKEK